MTHYVTPQAAYHYYQAITRLPEVGNEYLDRAAECRRVAEAAEQQLSDAHVSAQALWEQIASSGIWTPDELFAASFVVKPTEQIAKLPEICASRHPVDDSPILIRRGEMGYWPATPPAFNVDAFNARHGVTPAQKLAMEIGSMCGFDVPGADPDEHTNQAA